LRRCPSASSGLLLPAFAKASADTPKLVGCGRHSLGDGGRMSAVKKGRMDMRKLLKIEDVTHRIKQGVAKGVGKGIRNTLNPFKW